MLSGEKCHKKKTLPIEQLWIGKMGFCFTLTSQHKTEQIGYFLGQEL